MGIIESVNLADKFRQFRDYWSPKIIGELKDSDIRTAKLKGEFLWHHHIVVDRVRWDEADEDTKTSCSW